MKNYSSTSTWSSQYDINIHRRWHQIRLHLAGDLHKLQMDFLLGTQPVALQLRIFFLQCFNEQFFANNNNNNDNVLNIVFWKWYHFQDSFTNAKEQVQKLLQGMPSWSKYLRWTNMDNITRLVTMSLVRKQSCIICIRKKCTLQVLKWCNKSMSTLYVLQLQDCISNKTKKGFLNLVTGDTWNIMIQGPSASEQTNTFAESKRIVISQLTLVMDEPTDTIARE